LKTKRPPSGLPPPHARLPDPRKAPPAASSRWGAIDHNRWSNSIGAIFHLWLQGIRSGGSFWAVAAAVYCCSGPWQLFSALDLWSYGATELRSCRALGSRLFILKNHHHPIVACADGWGFNSTLDIYKLHSIYTQHESVIFTFLQSSE